MSSRLRVSIRRAVAGAALSGLLATGVAGLAQADPALTVEEAKAQVAQLEVEAAAIDQQYVAVKSQLDAGRQRLKTKQGDVQAQTAQVNRAKRQVGQVALAQFQNRNLDTAAQLFLTEETDDFLSQISTVEKVSENQNSVLQEYQSEQAKLTELTRSAQGDLAVLERQEKELGALTRASDTKIAESKAVLARLTAEERAKIAAEERRLLAEARAAAERAERAERSERGERSTRDRDRDPGTDRDRTGSRPDAPSPSDSGADRSSSSKGQRAVAFARSQLGKPYARNGSGPGSYDCSGLTLKAWQAAGVSLPRTSTQQASVGRAVSRSELQPGDLVFFYSPISHVALYVGDGQILHSPRPGKTVEYSKMSYMPFTSARRPG